MKVIYEPSVLEQIDAIINGTFGAQRRIARIELNADEWHFFARALSMSIDGSEYKCRDTTYRGVRVIYER